MILKSNFPNYSISDRIDKTALKKLTESIKEYRVAFQKLNTQNAKRSSQCYELNPFAFDIPHTKR